MKKKSYSKDMIYGLILNDIINFNYKPGDYIREHNIVEKYNLSRTPVREILNKLANNGYIKNIPNKGNVVKRINMNRVKQMMQLRIILENKCAYTIMTADNINYDTLNIIIDEQKIIVDESRSKDDFFELDNKFHKTIFDLARKNVWWEIIQKDEPHYMRFRKLDLTIDDNINLLFMHHKNILDCIVDGRINEIEDIIKSHIYCCITRVPLLQELYENYFII